MSGELDALLDRDAAITFAKSAGEEFDLVLRRYVVLTEAAPDLAEKLLKMIEDTIVLVRKQQGN